MKPLRVYISGPYSSDPEKNTLAAMEAATQVLDAGHAPFLPHLSHYWHSLHPRPWEAWLRLDLAWVAVADVVYRMPGDSPGADLEVEEALRLGIPVVDSLVTLLAAEVS